MDNFVVSARKYRPQHFNTVVGQSHITSTLKNAIISRQLAQAYLFCGPRGVGKTTCARIFAKTINCQSLTPEGEACDACESCLSFNSGASLNVYELDAASNNSVEDIRNLVDQVRFAPQLGDYKVYIIDEVHMLSTAAFNAFLKTLEEPPRHAKFILATTEKHKIIPTILSRCQVFNFNRIRVEDISSHLIYLAGKENVSYEPEALHVIAQKADGGLRDACSIFDQMIAFTGNHLTYQRVVENLNVLDYDYYFRITDALLEQRLPEVMLTFDDILRKGFDGHHLVLGLGEHFRNLLVCRDPQTVVLLETSENLRERYVAQAQKCHAQFLLRALALISKTDVNYKIARNQRLLVEITLMQLAHMNASPEAEKKNDIDEIVAKPATARPEPVAEQVIKTSSKPSLSLDQLRLRSAFSLNEAKAPSGPEAHPQQEVQVAAVPDKPVSAEEVKQFVRSYATARQQEGSRQVATIFSTAVVELKDETISLTISNETQKEQLMEVRHQFIDAARASLQNFRLQLDVQINELPVTSKAYKPADIFRQMSERNPHLLDLKKRFDLEIDY